MAPYPAVELMVKHGAAISLGIAAMPVLAGLLAVAFGAHWLVVPAAIIVAAVVYLLMKTFAELVAIIADMLMPK